MVCVCFFFFQRKTWQFFHFTYWMLSTICLWQNNNNRIKRLETNHFYAFKSFAKLDCIHLLATNNNNNNISINNKKNSIMRILLDNFTKIIIIIAAAVAKWFACSMFLLYFCFCYLMPIFFRLSFDIRIYYDVTKWLQKMYKTAMCRLKPF